LTDPNSGRVKNHAEKLRNKAVKTVNPRRAEMQSARHHLFSGTSSVDKILQLPIFLTKFKFDKKHILN
jgi:hypothetical protein